MVLETWFSWIAIITYKVISFYSFIYLTDLTYSIISGSVWSSPTFVLVHSAKIRLTQISYEIFIQFHLYIAVFTIYYMSWLLSHLIRRCGILTCCQSYPSKLLLVMTTKTVSWMMRNCPNPEYTAMGYDLQDDRELSYSFKGYQFNELPIAAYSWCMTSIGDEEFLGKKIIKEKRFSNEYICKR